MKNAAFYLMLTGLLILLCVSCIGYKDYIIYLSSLKITYSEFGFSFPWMDGHVEDQCFSGRAKWNGPGYDSGDWLALRWSADNT